ncbi:MAG TPA: glucosaminidase domain-containing protein [Saprospiraceae bacterium]|nr:glucosaminidase domain-containing protein [Saprospiraceae bacterium]
MGYAKGHYSDPEAYKPQQGNRPTSSNNRRRRSNMTPGRIVVDKKEKESFVVAGRLVWHRFRRSLIALRFRINYYTLGFFRRNTLIKLGTLVLGGYFLLFAEAGPQIIAREPKQSEQGIGTFIEDATETKQSKPVKAKTKPKNEASPVGASELFSEQAEDYVERFQSIARGEMKKYGIPASISLAQGLIESRAGTSKLAVNNNNHFGIKCFSRNCKKGHCTNFTDDTHKDFFRKFQNPWESWRAHSQLIATGRYTKLKKNGRDYRKWAYGLKSIGYATDRNYAEKLIGIIERYELYKYDR